MPVIYNSKIAAKIEPAKFGDRRHHAQVKARTRNVTGFAGAVEPSKNMVSFARRNFRAGVRHARGWPIPYRRLDGGGRLVRFIEHVLAKHLGWQGRKYDA